MNISTKENNAAMPKVSVIIPVYNVAEYIERCARSLFEQTLDDMELIFIDDCTPDNSVEIIKRVLDEYPQRKQQTRIFKMPTNSRQAAVRRHGLKIATGDFVINCDADDWVDTDLYEMMYGEAIRSGADIVICPIRDEYGRYGKTRPFPKLPETCKEALQYWYCNGIEMYAWNKLTRRSVITENDLLPYEGINMWEDNGMFLRVFYYTKGLSGITSSVYHYNRANVSAMTHGYGRDAVNQMIDCAQRISSFFESKPDYKRFKKTVLALKLYARINLITDSYKGLREYRTTFPESNAIIPEIRLCAFSTKGKIRFIAVKYKLAWLFVALFKLRNLFKK